MEDCILGIYQASAPMISDMALHHEMIPVDQVASSQALDKVF